MTQSHMAREIAEIPEVAARFLTSARPALTELGQALRAREIDLAVTLARGSSNHAATFLKYAIELQAGLPVASVGPSVSSIYKRPLRLTRAFCIGISQSGRSPDIVDAMTAAQAGGAETVAITNFADSPMAQAASHRLALSAGEEKSVAATKTFVTSALAGLAVLAEWQEDRALSKALAAAPDALSGALAQDWEPLMARLARAQSVFVLGRGPGVAMANEAALKLKETSGLHADPIALQRCCTALPPSSGRNSRCWPWGSRMRPCRSLPRRRNGWRSRARMCSSPMPMCPAPPGCPRPRRCIRWSIRCWRSPASIAASRVWPGVAVSTPICRRICAR